jgi:hypothetical protein
MTYDEFQRQVHRAGLNLRQFAELTKMNRISISNRKGTSYVPSHWAIIAVLMAEMAEHQLDFLTPLAKVDIQPKKPRGRGIGQQPDGKGGTAPG